MALYTVNDTQTVAGTTDTTLTVERGASKRFKVVEVTSGFTLASPSDNLLTVKLQRFTTADGAGDALTPSAVDPADGASVATALGNHSTEPTTYVAASELIHIGQHMRATYRWVARPGGEFVVANTASVGVGLFAEHASVTPEHVGFLMFDE